MVAAVCKKHEQMQRANNVHALTMVAAVCKKREQMQRVKTTPCAHMGWIPIVPLSVIETYNSARTNVWVLVAARIARPCCIWRAVVLRDARRME